MNRKSGVLRRVVILGLFAWFYSRFVLNGSLFYWSPEIRDGLTWLLYACVAWGIVTLFADRGSGRSNREETNTDDNSPSPSASIGSDRFNLDFKPEEPLSNPWEP